MSFGDGNLRTAVRDLQLEIERLKAERVEVVRCRDCKWSDKIITRYQKETVYACLNFDSACVEPDGFCAWGERND